MGLQRRRRRGLPPGWGLLPRLSKLAGWRAQAWKLGQCRPRHHRLRRSRPDLHRVLPEQAPAGLLALQIGPTSVTNLLPSATWEACVGAHSDSECPFGGIIYRLAVQEEAAKTCASGFLAPSVDTAWPCGSPTRVQLHSLLKKGAHCLACKAIPS